MVKIIFHLDLPKQNIINVSCDIGEQIKELNITHLIHIEEMLSIIQIPLNALESTKASTKWDLCFFMAYHVFRRITWHCYIIKASLMINFKKNFCMSLFHYTFQDPAKLEMPLLHYIDNDKCIPPPVFSSRPQLAG